MKIQDPIPEFLSEDDWLSVPFRKEYVLESIGSGNRVLDLGCMGGKFSRMILERRNDVWGVELNPDSAKEASQRGIQATTGNVEDGLPFEKSFFDVVHASGLIQYLYDTKFVFEECARVLRDGGLFLFSFPNLNSLENRLRVLQGSYLEMAGAYPEDHFGRHIRFFNLDKVHELCRGSGFRIEEIRGVPALESKGKWMDASLGFATRMMPGLSKILMIKARKLRSS